MVMCFLKGVCFSSKQRYICEVWRGLEKCGGREAARLDLDMASFLSRFTQF